MSDKPTIAMHECKSTCITHHGYDAGSKTLALKFNGGRTYHYADVPAEAYEALKGAKSIGKHFGTNISGKFKASPP